MSVSGSRWHRVDFHLHTPGVDSFASHAGMNLDDSGDQCRFAEAYARRLHEAGIDVAAITDYNGIRQPWFDLIGQAANRYGIVVLPGAELSLTVGRNGIHVLVVFPVDSEPQKINEVLRALQRQPGTELWEGRSHRELELRMPAAEALRHLRERFGCLLIAAHPGERKGIIQAMGAKLAAQLIAEADLDGLDHAPDARSKLISTAVPHRWEHLSLLEFSDPRRIEDIGGKTRADGTVRGTWLKLSAIDIDAIRLALHDPQTRVRTTEPVTPCNGRITSMAIDGRGFLADLDIAFDPHLNTFIGGRGTGKSAVLETIRYALNAQPYSDPVRRNSLVAHALGSGGCVRLHVERHTESGAPSRYEIVRALGRDPQVVDLDTGNVVGIDPMDTFGPNRAPIILLQHEIEAIGTDLGDLRNLLDRLIGDDVREAERRVADLCRELAVNGSELHKHRLEQSRRPEHTQRITRLEHELTVYENNGVLDKLAAHRTLDGIGRDLGTALDETDSDSIEAWASSLDVGHERLSDLHERFDAHDDDIIRQTQVVLGGLAEQISALRVQVGVVINTAHETLTMLSAQHDQRVQQLTAALDEVKQTLHADKFDADLVLRHTAELDRLRTAIGALDRKMPAIEQLTSARRGILDRLTKARAAESRIRQDAADMINSKVNGRIEVIVDPFGDREQFTTSVKELLKGSNAIGAVISAIAAIPGMDGAALAALVEQGPDRMATDLGITPAQALNIYSWLSDPAADRIADLETLAPRDRVGLRLCLGEGCRDLAELSPGQRATAILLLIFAADGRAMLLDQPEDDLDNRFIFEDVVTMIRQQKALTMSGQDRQIIAATHNPNIPMLGDAELVAVLDAGSSTMAVTSCGSIDALEIRTHIRQVLEGGEEAFLRRYQKYGGMWLQLPGQRHPR